MQKIRSMPELIRREGKGGKGAGSIIREHVFRTFPFKSKKKFINFNMP
jgi:hypothetical protein